MSGELQSMLKFQADRLAVGGLSSDQFQELARRYLELERQNRLACLEPIAEPLLLAGRLQAVGEIELGT